MTQEEVDAHLRKFKGDNNSAVSPADAKSVGRVVAKTSAEAQEVHPRYRIHIHHRSRQLSDATGRSHKAAVDGIVRGGLFPDDSPEYLEAINETYEQADIEETILTVVEICDSSAEERLARTNSRKVERDQETFRSIGK